MTTPPNGTTTEEDANERRLREIEAQAVDKAKATADAAFRPSPSMLNAPSASVLLRQVDGPSLSTYDSKESIYVGRSIQIHDINFGITAEREEGNTIVKASSFFLFLLLVLE